MIRKHMTVIDETHHDVLESIAWLLYVPLTAQYFLSGKKNYPEIYVIKSIHHLS